MKNLPRIVRTAGGFSFLINEEPFIMLAAEAHNSACTSRHYMQNVWKRAKELNCNTVLAPVYWELIEPQEHHFEFDSVSQLLSDARSHSMKLVLLWFGSWKNGHSTYVPNWIKTDLERFPRTEDESGVKTRTLSMFRSDLLTAELNSFTNFMKFLKESDLDSQTVIAVQVENEVGILGAARDFSPGAAEEYRKDVPRALIEHIEKAGTSFLSEAADIYKSASDKSWANIFRRNADEAFMCWNYSLHINRLVKSGKACYALFMFTNAWLKESDDEKPGVYPCGGPVPEMLDIWKCGAPDLDALSPDLYTFSFEKAAGLYTRSDNPLFIAETRRDKWAPANLYGAVGTYHALCYSPFGAESIGEDKSFITQIMHTNPDDKNVSSKTVKEYLSMSYRLLGNSMPLIAGCYGSDKMIGFIQNDGCMTKQIRLGRYLISLEFYHPINDVDEFIPGAGLAIQQSENELIFLGYGYRANIETADPGRQLDFLSLEKGTFDKDTGCIRYMHLNGDEQRIQMEEKPTILKASYYEF
ncbi:DUF5597 domain-containing protein [Lachnotalea sp. AF33-28]|uniref:DUF5597 domain-containing protein n=1 Tax=Lachnotalea sp. AF33-28 TaxID=2292046 RepID=UPI000E555CD2|nr:DUF5597 domain-containing protein [Lachnotalea sp. AF33-28]RHP36319.1 hypothetical protein DWZ56_01295 [Lachnotalea sp. AF33-28]